MQSPQVTLHDDLPAHRMSFMLQTIVYKMQEIKTLPASQQSLIVSRLLQDVHISIPIRLNSNKMDFI